MSQAQRKHATKSHPRYATHWVPVQHHQPGNITPIPIFPGDYSLALRKVKLKMPHPPTRPVMAGLEATPRVSQGDPQVVPLVFGTWYLYRLYHKIPSGYKASNGDTLWWSTPAIEKKAMATSSEVEFFSHVRFPAASHPHVRNPHILVVQPESFLIKPLFWNS